MFDLLWMLVLGLGAVAIWGGLCLSIAKRVAFHDREAELFRVALPADGHNIALFRIRPRARAFREPVILCHGLGANRFNVDFVDDGTGSDRLSLARFLSRAGFDTWVLELRGRGLARVPKGADWSVDDEVHEDVPTAIQTVLEQTGAKRVFWVGHSKGGIVQYLLHARADPAAQAIAGLVTIGSPAALKPRLWILVRLLPVGRFLARIFGKVPLRFVSSVGLPLADLIHLGMSPFLPAAKANDGRVLRRLMRNLSADISPGVLAQFSRWLDGGGHIIGEHEGESFENVKVPLLLIAGNRDLLAPPEAVEVMNDYAGSEDRTFVVVGREPSEPDFGHGDLVVGTHAPDFVYPKVEKWLSARAERISETETETETGTVTGTGSG